MDIIIESLLEGSKRATGAVAIIDVFRAFTTAAVALAGGASQILMVGTVEEALSLRASGVGQICMGEVGGDAPPGFDFGNSPYDISQANVRGKTIIHRTSAGTQGIVTAIHAQSLFATSLVTATATARALSTAGYSPITIVAMGDTGLTRTSEDEICALHLRNLLEGRPGNAEAAKQMILAGKEWKNRHFSPNDVEIALDVDRFDFAVQVVIENERPVARINKTTM